LAGLIASGVPMTGDEQHVDGPADCGESESDGEPFDLHAVLSDDALLNALGPDGLDNTTIRERFADSQPDALIDLLLTVRGSAGAVDAREPDVGRPASSGCGGPASRSSRPVGGGAPEPRRSLRISLTLAAAALTAALLAPGIEARAAVPGDALWPVTLVLYPGRVVSVDAADQVTRRLDAAAAAMVAGDDRAARIELQAAEGQLSRVSAKDGRPALQARHGDLDRALHVATGDDADAGARTTQPSPGPARRGPTAHPVPPASQLDTPMTVSTTTAAITTRPPEGARRRTGERPAVRPDESEAPRTTPGRPEQGHTRAPGAAHRTDTARPAGRPRPPEPARSHDRPRALGEGSPAVRPRPAERARPADHRRPAKQRRPADEGRRADQPRRAEPARSADQPRAPDQPGSPGAGRTPGRSGGSEPAHRSDQTGTADSRPAGRDRGGRNADRGRQQQPAHDDPHGGRSADAGAQGHDRSSGRSGS
jgi:hypothetical protein